jgi:hypothetical protein
MPTDLITPAPAAPGPTLGAQPAPAPITPPAAPVEAVQAAPAVVAPVVAPVVEAPVAPVVAPVEVKAETVLGNALDTKTPPTPEAVRVEAVVETPKTEGQSAEPAPPPVYDTFTVPEGVTLDDTRVTEFTKVLSDLETTGKVPHELVQKFGQTMVDTHIAEVKKATDALTELYKQTWDRQKIEWKDAFLKDPEIGGNRFQTTVNSALNFIRTHGGTPEQQTEFRNLMETSGLGNHPAVIRLLASAGRAMAEGVPLAAQKPVPAPKSRVSTMYGGMT